jgi:hypothetical protein
MGDLDVDGRIILTWILNGRVKSVRWMHGTPSLLLQMGHY